METESEQNANSTTGGSGSASGGSNRPQISQMSLYERQAVQALQALQRQPNAAQYFHQFMLQQQLSTAQLHSLAAVQQASIAASRQASSPNSSTPQQTTTTQASLNLATTSAAQLISRSQSVSTPSATTLTQSVLLGSTSSPPLNQSQAQMYLRQPQLGNLLVNRSLSRSVPLTSQLILMPNGAVAVQQEVSPTQSPGVLSDTDQVQNLAVRSQQTTASSTHLQSSTQKAIVAGNSQSSATTHSQTISLAVSQASAGQSLNLSQAALAAGGSGNGCSGGTALNTMAGACQGKGTGVVQPLPASQASTVSQGSQTETEARKMDPDGVQTVGMNLTRSSTPAPSQTLISSATYTQIQPHSMIQQQQIHLQQKQVVIQQQIAIHHQQQFQHRQSQMLHTATHLQLAQQHQGTSQQQQQPQQHQQHQQQAQTLVVQPMIQSQQSALQLQATTDGPGLAVKTPVPIQPKQPTKPMQPMLGAKMLAQPHIPVQVVGSRQQGPGQAQALGLTQVTMGAGLAQQGGGHFSSHAPSHSPLQQLSPHSTTSSQGLTMTVAPAMQEPNQNAGVNLVQVQGTITTAQMARNPAQMSAAPQTPAVTATTNYILPGHLTGKFPSLAVKRKAESEEEKEEVPAQAPVLPVAKTASAANSPRPLEEKIVLPEKSEVGQVAAQSVPVSSSTVVPTLALASRQNGDSKPPQAVVKPQILTHVIEGFVIQEGAEPFPVGSSQLLKESEKQTPGETASDVPDDPCDPLEGDNGAMLELEKKASLLKCEYCGKYAPANQFRGSKRFCSMTCAKRYNVSCSHQYRLKRKKMELQEANNARARRRGPRRSSSEITLTNIPSKRLRTQEDSSRGSDNSSYDEAFSPTSPGPASGRSERDPGTPNSAPPTSDLLGISPVFLSSDPGSWNVEEVYQFIASLQGCQEIAEDFRSQEIDGQALLLLKEEHLMTAMNIKLGPALKICAKINVLKET